MKSNQYRMAVLAGIMILLLIPMKKVYAGSINANEQALLNYAAGTFEYEGKTYKATSEALAMVRAKLASDNVDLTDEQLQKVYNMAPGYLGTAISKGYLVETAIMDGDPDVTKETPQPEKEVGENAEKQDASEIMASAAPAGNENYLEGTIRITDGEAVVFEGSMPVKNTGYTTKKGLFVTGMLGAAFLMVILKAIQYIAFARNEHE